MIPLVLVVENKQRNERDTRSCENVDVRGKIVKLVSTPRVYRGVSQ